MNRKHIALAVSVLALMIVGIVALVRSLYTEKEPDRPEASSSAYAELLAAVPSDAALVFCLDGSRAAQRLAADSTGVLGAFISPGSPAELRAFLSHVAREKTVVSLHNSGALVPLVVASFPHADSASLAPVVALAASAGLKTACDAGLLLASRSETLVGTARRHLSDGYSILQSEGFSEALSSARDGNAVLVNGSYSAKIYQVFAAPARRSHASAAGNMARWLSFGIGQLSRKGIDLAGSAVTADRNYLRVFSGNSQAEAAFPEVLPSEVQSAVSVVVPDLDSYLEGFARYRDARSGQRTLDDAWVRHLSVREAVRATLADGARVFLVRCASEPAGGKGIHPDPHAAEIAACFGAPFSGVKDTLCLKTGKWLVYGPEKALSSLSEGPRLKKLLSDAGISLEPLNGVVCYAAVNGTLLGELFSPAVATSLTPYIQGIPLVPSVLEAGSAAGHGHLSFRLARLETVPGDAPMTALRDTAVLVPKGPFKVRNSATGKDNTLYQNAHLSICLKDENGKDQWGVPFKEPFCGCVETIDYYANGRLQFLFAAGSKLYLIDRLGRFVNGFPVDLGKEVLLGPAAYDFTGAHGYRAMVLHKDNTLSLYNLHGQKAEGWQDITPAEPVKGLPEYVDGGDGKHYWLVPTAVGTAVYGFHGGEPLPKKEAARILKRTKTNG